MTNLTRWKGAVSITTSFMRDFLDWIKQHNLVDLHMEGHLIQSNNQDDPSMWKIDRFLVLGDG